MHAGPYREERLRALMAGVDVFSGIATCLERSGSKSPRQPKR